MRSPGLRQRRSGNISEGVDPLEASTVAVEHRLLATSSPYSSRSCYCGIGEFSVYVRRDCRRQEAGRAVLGALIEAAAQAGLHSSPAGFFRRTLQAAPCSPGSVRGNRPSSASQWRCGRRPDPAESSCGSDISSPPCLLRLLPAGANRRVGLTPTGRRRLLTAHTQSGRYGQHGASPQQRSRTA